MRTDLYQLFYISRSLATPQEVEDILIRARELNASRQVTGSLMFTGGHFAQVLEGPAVALADTMAAITADRRHEDLRRLIAGDLAARRFGHWSMGYAEAPGADDLIADLLAAPSVPPERAQRLLSLMFKP